MLPPLGKDRKKVEEVCNFIKVKRNDFGTDRPAIKVNNDIETFSDSDVSVP